MEAEMVEKEVNIYIGATSVHTALGNTAESMDAMYSGETGLQYNNRFCMYAGIVDVHPLDNYTRFESLIIEQLNSVVSQSAIRLSDKDVQLIISTTKGNVDILSTTQENDSIEQVFLSSSAQAIAEYFGCVNTPIVISNACISGVSALVVAREHLLSQTYKHAIVVGCDVLSEFITQGFASFKSISAQPCRPYDAERDGLTLGEACAAIVLTTDIKFATYPYIRLNGGAITNDANHISGPSRTGDGLYYAIESAMKQAGITCEDVGFVNTHGTATRYNDEMESKAIAWAKLDAVPLNSIKGYIGHTLGASGVVETVICTEELRQGSIVGTKGFRSSDTPHKLNISAENVAIQKPCCVKTASGFGGCNAAIVLDMSMQRECQIPQLTKRARVVAEYTLPQSELPFAEFIRLEFKSMGKKDMKFYKMSDMCKAWYVAVERLIKKANFEEVAPIRRAIILANHSASLDADLAHQHIINQHLPEGASPAVFGYTLANVAAGEMCIKHRIQGNNTFFIEKTDNGIAQRYAEHLIMSDSADAVICGWCEYLQGKWNVNVKLLKN